MNPRGFQKFDSFRKVGFIYINVISRIFRYSVKTMYEAEVAIKMFLHVEKHFLEATYSTKTRKECKLTFAKHIQCITLTFVFYRFLIAWCQQLGLILLFRVF